jgi:hypothetical protein
MQPLDVLAHGHLGPEASGELHTAELFGNPSEEVPQSSEPFGNEPVADRRSSEPFRSAEPALPNPSESFRNEPVPDRRFSEGFGSEVGNLPNVSADPDIAAERFGNRSFAQRREDHTLTIKEVVKQFEAAGVARTERSVVNWCQPNKDGVARLDAYFDPNERRYFIAPNSVAHAIEEEKQKLARVQSPAPPVAETTTPVSETFRNEPMTERRPSEPFGNEPVADRRSSEAFRNESEPEHRTSESFRSEPVTDRRSFGKIPHEAEESVERMRELEREVMDLKITNRAKDMFIEQLKTERETDVRKLTLFSRKIGEMASRLLQLGAPKEEVKNVSSLDNDDERSLAE